MALDADHPVLLGTEGHDPRGWRIAAFSLARTPILATVVVLASERLLHKGSLPKDSLTKHLDNFLHPYCLSPKVLFSADVHTHGTATMSTSSDA
jgi:hypothetical protein